MNQSELGRYVFVLVTSTTCGHCRTFLNRYWDLLKERLMMINSSLRIIHVEMSEMIPISSDSFNPEIMKYITAFPSMVCMPYDEFIYSPLVMKKEYVYGVDDNYIPDRKSPRDATSIENWVQLLIPTVLTTVSSPTKSVKYKRDKR